MKLVFLALTFMLTAAYGQTGIVVQKASWGTKDVKSFASAFCDSKTSCDYKVSPKFIGAHGGPLKFFNISWTCNTSKIIQSITLPSDATNKIASLKCDPPKPVVKRSGQATCNTDFVTIPEKCDAASQWIPEYFSDPESLEGSTEFKIVFHSITAFGWIARGAPDVGSWNEKLLHDPSIISNNPKISASFITETKNKTFIGFLGIILEVHPENVIVASSSDVGSPRILNYSATQLAQLKTYASNQPLKSPDDVFNQTLPERYNEIVLVGRPSMGQEVRAVGLLLSCKTTKMTKLNRLTDYDFDTFVNSKCHSFDQNVLEALKKHRGTYPIYAYPIKAL